MTNLAAGCAVLAKARWWFSQRMSAGGMSLACKRFSAYCLLVLLMLQTFSREVLVVDFTLNQATITARFCVNKSRPKLHCDGKCYFARQLKKQEERESKSAGPLKERLEMLPVAFRSLVPPAPARWATAPVGYAASPAPAIPARAARGLFRPPQA